MVWGLRRSGRSWVELISRSLRLFPPRLRVGVSMISMEDSEEMDMPLLLLLANKKSQNRSEVF